MTMTAPESAPSSAAADAPRWVLLAQEALARGFRNALAFRRWWRKRRVPIVTEGKFQWVSPA